MGVSLATGFSCFSLLFCFTDVIVVGRFQLTFSQNIFIQVYVQASAKQHANAKETPTSWRIWAKALLIKVHLLKGTLQSLWLNKPNYILFDLLCGSYSKQKILFQVFSFVAYGSGYVLRPFLVIYNTRVSHQCKKKSVQVLGETLPLL